MADSQGNYAYDLTSGYPRTGLLEVSSGGKELSAHQLSPRKLAMANVPVETHESPPSPAATPPQPPPPPPQLPPPVNGDPDVRVKLEVMEEEEPSNEHSKVADTLREFEAPMEGSRLNAEDADDIDDDEDDYLNHEYSNGVDDERYSPMSGNMEFGLMTGDILRSEDFQPNQDTEGNQILDVDCGANRALLYINKLCQGSKGQSIFFEGRWHTPNEFQYISGRETAKDWKRSIRHRGKSLKILMSRGLLQTRQRPVDKRGSSCSAQSLNNNNNSIEKKARVKPVVESEPSQLNQIINHLHQTNGSHLLGAREIPRKRTCPLDYRNGKRSRSMSPAEGDIYDEQQRCIFQAANSPEPQNIENARKSLNLNASSPTSPSVSSTSAPSSPVSFVLGDPQSLSYDNKQDVLSAQKTSRKQNSPQHFETQNVIDKEREVSRSPHIVLVSSAVSTAFQKGQASLRARFHSYQPSTRINGSTLIHGPLQQSPSCQEAHNRRTQSLLTPTTKAPPVKMIELTRPDAVSNTPQQAFPNTRNSSSLNFSHTADTTSPSSARTPTNDAVFLPGDMSLWTTDDVVQFIQSLKGCEEYVQVFRDQAIDGEILPVLTEDHLLQNMGLKLGPALKIRLRVARRLGFMLDGQYCHLKPPYEETH